MRRRHNLAHHDWGIVAGLVVSPADTKDPASALVVTPGVAIDGYGRELFLPSAVTVTNDILKKNLGYPNQSIDVWLVYRRLPAGVSGKPLAGGGDVPPMRWLEKAVLRVVNASPKTLDPTFGVQDVPSDDPALEWPVFLGRVLSDKVPLPADPSKTPVRRYAVLYGERVESPAGGTLMRVGVSDDGQKSGFAVGLTVPKPPDTQASGATTAPSTPAASQPSQTTPAAEAIETLVIDGVAMAGKPAPITIARGMAIGPVPDRPEGLLLDPLSAGAGPAPPMVPAPSGTGSRPRIPPRLRLGDRGAPAGTDPVGLVFGRRNDPPPGDVFWRIYRVLQPNADKTLPAVDQLRIEILNPADKGDPARNQFAIIATSKTDPGDRFRPDSTRDHPCLTVAADGTVTIGLADAPPGNFGDLIVEGQYLEGPITTDPSDLRFLASLQAGVLAGLVSGKSALTLEVSPPSFSTSTGTTTDMSFTLTIRNLARFPLTQVTINGSVDERNGAGTKHPIALLIPSIPAGGVVPLVVPPTTNVPTPPSPVPPLTVDRPQPDLRIALVLLGLGPGGIELTGGMPDGAITVNVP
jgi:hypothetical protein